MRNIGTYKRKVRFLGVLSVIRLLIKPLKRLIAALILILYIGISGVTTYPFMLLFFGIDKANDFVDKYLPGITDWLD